MSVVNKRHYFVLLASVALFIGCSGEVKSNNPEANPSATLSNESDTARERSGQDQDSKKSETSEKKVEKISAIKVTFVELGSVNCIPCKMMQPIMKEVEKEYGDQVNVVFYDVWTREGSPYAEKYGIRLIPTQVFLDKNGKEYFRHEGYFPEEELVKVLKQGGVN